MTLEEMYKEAQRRAEALSIFVQYLHDGQPIDRAFDAAMARVPGIEYDEWLKLMNFLGYKAIDLFNMLGTRRTSGEFNEFLTYAFKVRK